MNRVRFAAIALASTALLSLGCAAETADPGELTAEQTAALEASIAHLAPVRPMLPVEDVELRGLATLFVLDSQAASGCAQKGIVSGVWYGSDDRPVFEGSWFELGSGELGGTVQGSYTEGHYVGEVTGPELDGTIEGPYQGGQFDGAWTATVGETDVLHDGELIGRYERRNDRGGYFFGVWTDCSVE